MPNGACNMCFKHAEVTQIVPDVSVCKACRYALNKHLDFWQYYGYGLQKLSVIGGEDKPASASVDGKIEGDKRAKIEKEGVSSTKTPKRP